MIVIAEPSTERRVSLGAAVAPAGDHVEVAALEQVTDELAPVGGTGRVVVLGPGLDLDQALRYAEKVERQGTRTATLLVLETLDAPRLREALRSGVDDVLTVEATAEEWAEAIGRARARVASDQPVASDPGGTSRGTIVSVFSTKGGCGKSLVASNLAVLAAERMVDDRVALVDLDLQSGDLAVMLQVVPALSIYDAAQSTGRLDADLLEGYLTPHPSGLSLLAAPLEPSLADQVSPLAVTRILDLMRTTFGLTIVDTPALFTEQVLAALDASDRIVLVGSMDVPSIKNLRSAMTTLAQLGHPREHLSIVLNRADSKVGLRVSEVERSLGVSIDVRIPSNRDVPLSVNQGTPLASSRRRSSVVTAIAELLDPILPAHAVDTARRRRAR